MMIEPKIPKGFRDALPRQETVRKQFERRLEKVFESYGFRPIDTPVIEYTEVLLGKGGGETDKQIFRFTDNGGREVAMRFDLTVPLARFVSLHKDEISFPFKRYHISKVFRGEKPQKGRYREFKQCDFDIVGADNASSDFEIVSMMVSSLKALNVGNFTIHLSHRGMLNDFLASVGVSDKSQDVLRAVDKLQKIGEENVKAELTDSGLTQEQVASVMKYINPGKGDFPAVLETLVQLIGKETESTRRVREIYGLIEATGIKDCFVLDPSITRGLDYYTGVVFETFVSGAEFIGSVCSGGRYNNLASLYTKENLPGVGSCVGIDRLIACLEELGKLSSTPKCCDVVFFNPEDSDVAGIHKAAARMRAAGLKCDVYLGNRKTKDQYAYAQDKGALYAVLSTDGESVSLKNLCTRETSQVSVDTAIQTVLRS